jgi:hypothetical protein
MFQCRLNRIRIATDSTEAGIGGGALDTGMNNQAPLPLKMRLFSLVNACWKTGYKLQGRNVRIGIPLLKEGNYCGGPVCIICTKNFKLPN